MKQNAEASAWLAISLQDLGAQGWCAPTPSDTSAQHRTVSCGPGQGLKLNREAWTDQGPLSSGVAPRRHICAADIT